MIKEYIAPETEELEMDVESGILNPSFASNSNDAYDYEKFGWN